MLKKQQTFESSVNDYLFIFKQNIIYLNSMKNRITRKELENKLSDLVTSLSINLYSYIQQDNEVNLVYEQMAKNKER